MIGHGQQQRCGRDEALRLRHELLLHRVATRASPEDRRVEEAVVVLRHLKRLFRRTNDDDPRDTDHGRMAFDRHPSSHTVLPARISFSTDTATPRSVLPFEEFYHWLDKYSAIDSLFFQTTCFPRLRVSQIFHSHTVDVSVFEWLALRVGVAVILIDRRFHGFFCYTVHVSMVFRLFESCSYFDLENVADSTLGKELFRY